MFNGRDWRREDSWEVEPQRLRVFKFVWIVTTSSRVITGFTFCGRYFPTWLGYRAGNIKCTDLDWQTGFPN